MTSDDGPQFESVLSFVDELESGAELAGGRRRYDLLRYLVRAKLDDRGAEIKAYTIALDVLGRGQDFDPSTDSIVRVEVARLRDALELFYAKNQTRDVPRITIPKGTYQPTITFSTGVIDKAPPSPARQNRTGQMSALLVLPAIVVGTLAYWFLSENWAPKSTTLNRPIIEVSRFDSTLNINPSDFAFGFRQQLIADLAHLPTLLVRDSPFDTSRPDGFTAREPDYRLAIQTFGNENNKAISLTLTKQSEYVVTWVKTVYPTNDTGSFFEAIADSIENIAQEIGGPSGVIASKAASDIIVRFNAGGAGAQGDYECLIVSLASDARKDDVTRALSEECLTNAVASGTHNATLLAYYALNQFLMSGAAASDAETDILLNKAAEIARKATLADPFNALARQTYGSVLSSLDLRDAAIREYERAIELAPSRPEPYFLLGWQLVLLEQWDEGVALIEKGIAMKPDVPGWMLVPFALDAFRTNDFADSLNIARTIIEFGDKRGYSLAFAASLALGNKDLASTFFFDPRARTSKNPVDPMREVRISFSNPSILADYDQLIAAEWDS